MPTVSGNVGAVFNGGTITQPLVDALTADGLPLWLKGFPTGIGGVLIADDPGTGYVGGLPQGGRVEVQQEPSGAVQIIGYAGWDAAGGPFLDISDAAAVPSPDTWLFSCNSGSVIVKVSGHLFITSHSAPADAVVSTGECALWFDQTPGAAKLMVKAKDSNGTVVTGSLALA